MNFLIAICGIISKNETQGRFSEEINRKIFEYYFRGISERFLKENFFEVIGRIYESIAGEIPRRLSECQDWFLKKFSKILWKKSLEELLKESIQQILKRIQERFIKRILWDIYWRIARRICTEILWEIPKEFLGRFSEGYFEGIS